MFFFGLETGNWENIAVISAGRKKNRSQEKTLTPKNGAGHRVEVLKARELSGIVYGSKGIWSVTVVMRRTVLFRRVKVVKKGLLR